MSDDKRFPSESAGSGAAVRCPHCSEWVTFKLPSSAPSAEADKTVDEVHRECLAEVREELALADEIEREGIERVLYGKGHAEMVKLNAVLLRVLRGTGMSQ